MERAGPGGDIPFFLDQGGVIFRKLLSQFCSIPRRKYVLDKPLKGTFLPKICRVQANGTPLCKKVDLDMNCFEISRLAGLL